MVEPPGGHAVYIDAALVLPHVPPHQFPAQALTAALYAESGVRGVEIGSSCFGRVDESTGEFIPAQLELMRLALPRRVYSDNHLKYVAAALVKLYRKRDTIKGLRRVYAAKLLSHFTARFEPMTDEQEAHSMLSTKGTSVNGSEVRRSDGESIRRQDSAPIPDQAL